MKITVIGLGYVGLPLALQAALKGFDVIGVDKQDEIIEKTNNGICHLEEDFVKKLFQQVSIKAQKNVESSDVYIVCVPTPIDKTNEPDLSFLINAVTEINEVIQDKQLVVIESTIYPGTCEEIIKPILDKSKKEYLLTHCPERINPGDTKWNVSNIPRIIGGINTESVEAAKNLYTRIIDAEIVILSQIKAAEATKILENTFRDVNIAFINEMAQSFYKLKIDISEVIKGASTKPFGFMPFYPGTGVGGHCIAVDPYYMIEKGKLIGFDHVFLIQARKINSKMPEFTVEITQDSLNSFGYPVYGTRIAVLGISYKPDIRDDRESPSWEIIKILKKKHADLVVYDPYFKEKSTAGNLEQALHNTTCAIIATAHKEFLDYQKYKDLKLLVDGRNCLDKNKVRGMNIMYKGIGID